MGKVTVKIQFGWTPQNSVKKKCPLPVGCPAHLCGGEGKGGVTYEASRFPGLPACSGGDGNKERLCEHTLKLTCTRTRPTQVLSKNGSPGLVAKIKEPRSGQPLEEISLLWPLLLKRLFEISRLLLERIPG